MRSQAGQATVEWVGLVLLVGLVMGAAAAFAAPASHRGIGEAVARRLSCAAAGACAGAAATRAVRPGPSRARALDAFRRLRGLGAVTKRLWIVCLGYRRAMSELKYPRPPTEPMPLSEALETVNACLNPAAFLTED